MNNASIASASDRIIVELELTEGTYFTLKEFKRLTGITDTDTAIATCINGWYLQNACGRVKQ